MSLVPRDRLPPAPPRPLVTGASRQSDADRNESGPMSAAWWSETIGALVCVLLLPVWAWITGLNSHPFWATVLSVVLGFGIGFGISGVRRGGCASRCVAGVCLAILLSVAAAYVYALRSDPWLYP